MSSSLAVGRRGLEELELWLAGLFTAAELAAADLLLQLSVAGGDCGKAAVSTSTTPPSSPRSAGSCCHRAEDKEEVEQVDDRAEGKEEVEQVVVVVKDTAPSTELLDRRARKRYRLLSDLYAATSPVPTASAGDKRKRHRHGYDGSSSVELGGDEIRGGDY